MTEPTDQLYRVGIASAGMIGESISAGQQDRLHIAGVRLDTTSIGPEAAASIHSERD